MGRYEFLNPGASAGNSLIDVMAKQKDDARRQLIEQVNMKHIQDQDALDAQRTQAQIENWQANQESLKAEREATAAWRESQAAEQKSKAEGRTRFRNSVANWKNSLPYADLPDDQKQAWDIATMSPDDDLMKTLLGNMTNHANNKKGGYLWTDDGNGNKYNTWQWMEGVDGDQYHPRQFQPREPREPVDRGTLAGQALDDKGQPVPNSYVVLRNGKLETQTVPGAAGIKPKTDPKETYRVAIGNDGQPIKGMALNSKNQLVPLPEGVTAMQNVGGPSTNKSINNKADIHPSFLNALVQAQKTARTQGERGVNQAQNNIINMWNTTDRVVSAVTQIINHQAPETTNEEIMQHLRAEKILTEKELSDAAKILGVVR